MSQRLGVSWWSAWLMVMAMSQAAGQGVPMPHQQALSSDAASRPASAATSTPADGSHEAEAFVRRLIHDPRILIQPWSRMQKVLPWGCERQPDMRALNCPPMPGVISVQAYGNGWDIVSVALTSPMSCERLQLIIRRRFGAPARLDPSDPCEGYWNLGRWQPRSSLWLTSVRHKPGVVLLQMGMEQGP